MPSALVAPVALKADGAASAPGYPTSMRTSRLSSEADSIVIAIIDDVQSALAGFAELEAGLLHLRKL